MAKFSATKTKTYEKGELFEKDVYTEQANPDINFDNGNPAGPGGPLSVGGDYGAGQSNAKRIATAFRLPEPPEDADLTALNEGLVNLKLFLYLFDTTAGSTSPQSLWFQEFHRQVDWGEQELTWTTSPNPGVILINISLDISTVAVYKTFDFVASVFTFGYRWGDLFSCWIVDARRQSAKYTRFMPRDMEQTQRPYVELQYLERPPDQLPDLKAVPDPADATRPKLTWTPSEDSRFSTYRVFRKVGAGAYAQVGSDITTQGVGEFVDTFGGITENVVVYYKVRELTTSGSYNESNEVWLIRPDVSTFTVTDTTPDVHQTLTANIVPVALPATPTPVTNTDYYFEWGSSAQSDGSYGWTTTVDRKHIYGYAGSHTLRGRIKNNLGYYSDLTNLTTGGPTLTVASIAPVAKIRAAPTLALTGASVSFYGDESYSPPANKTIHAASGYEWDWDYTGTFAADSITTQPTATNSWGSAGTKTVALRVKDVDGTYSPVVTMTVEVVASVVVNLDALVDKFDFLDTDPDRQTWVYEGADTYETAQGGRRPEVVRIGGFASTDADLDNVPDDVETLNDVIVNRKKVQLTVLNVVRTGVLRGFKVHTQGGWALKYNWSSDVVLDP
jgi:hypothetical protein